MRCGSMPLAAAPTCASPCAACHLAADGPAMLGLVGLPHTQRQGRRGVAGRRRGGGADDAARGRGAATQRHEQHPAPVRSLAACRPTGDPRASPRRSCPHNGPTGHARAPQAAAPRCPLRLRPVTAATQRPVRCGSMPRATMPAHVRRLMAATPPQSQAASTQRTRSTGREGETDREREADRQTDRQTERRERERQRERQRDRQRDRQRAGTCTHRPSFTYRCPPLPVVSVREAVACSAPAARSRLGRQVGGGAGDVAWQSPLRWGRLLSLSLL